MDSHLFLVNFVNMLSDLKELFIEVFQLVIGYFYHLDKRINAFYLLTSVLLTLFVFYKRKKSQTQPSKNFIQYLFKKENYWSKTAFVDYAFLFFNGFVKISIIASFSYWSRHFQFNITEGLLDNWGYKPTSLSIPTLSVLYTIALLLIGDFSYYVLHLSYHKLPFLWAFHKVHHSSTALNPVTQYRIHPIELIINNLRFIVVITLLNGTFDYLSNGYYGPQTYLGVNIILITFNTWGANLRHSHVKLTYFNWLENWFISPYQHQIHHSSQKELHDKNFGSKLAIWDSLFGTLVKSKDISKLEVGLGEKTPHYNNFLKNLINPFKALFNSKY